MLIPSGHPEGISGVGFFRFPVAKMQHSVMRQAGKILEKECVTLSPSKRDPEP